MAFEKRKYSATWNPALAPVEGPADLLLTVTFTYFGSKVNLFSPTQPGERLHSKAINVLEEDLSALGMTSAKPKRTNIYVPSPGVVKFWWSPQVKNGMVYRLLEVKIRGVKAASPGTAVWSNLTDCDLKRRSILSTSMTEERGETEPDFLRNIEPVQKSIDFRSFFAQPVRIKQEVTEPSLAPTLNPLSGIRGPSNSLRLKNDAPARRRSIREMPAMELFSDDDNTSLPMKRKHTSTFDLPSKRQAVTRFGPPLEDKTRSRIQNELLDVRKRVIEFTMLEKELSEQLSEAAALDVPTIDMAPSEIAARTQVRLLQTELASERQKREKSDAIISDIRRECRAPFVVPALLDVFLSVSHFTNSAMKA
ncbi:hypothetical protein BDZ89DRAFT_1072738 [Hymenopellis radicata]|nr:hypothetical protein BDZ89DRAFT_1072738 [Hymenopellis radicata]